MDFSSPQTAHTRPFARLLASALMVVLGGMAAASTGAGSQEPHGAGPDVQRLPELRRSYVVLLDGEQQGTVDQTLRHHPDGFVRGGAEGGALRTAEPVWESTSRMSAPLQEHERTMVFSSPGLRPLLLEQRPLRGGEPVVLLRAEGPFLRGRVELPELDAAPREVEIELEEETVLSGMDEYLLAATALSPGKRLSVPMVDLAEGGITSVTFRVAEDPEVVEVPAGSFEVLRVHVAGGPAPQDLLVRREAPHVVIRQEFRGRPLTLELTHLDERAP